MNKFITTAAVLLMPMAMFAQSDRVQCTENTQHNAQCKNLAIVEEGSGVEPHTFLYPLLSKQV